MVSMKKSVLKLFALFIPYLAFAEVKEIVWTELQVAETRTVISDDSAISFYYTREDEGYDLFVGVQFASEQTTFDSHGKWIFKKEGRVKLGLEGIFSNEKYSDISRRGNYFAGLYSDIRANDRISVGSDILFGYKSVDYIGLDIERKWKFDTMLDIFLAWNCLENGQLKFAIMTRDDFFYQNFGYIIYALSLRNDFDSRISLKVSYSIRSIDMMTISSYVDGWCAKFTMGYRL